jgi:hypothetical protein
MKNMNLDKAIAVNTAITTLMEQELPISLIFKLERVVEKIAPDITAFFKKRQELLDKNSTKGEEEGTLTLTKEQQELVNEEITKMLLVEVPLAEELKLSQEEFAGLSDVKAVGNKIKGISALLKQ